MYGYTLACLAGKEFRQTGLVDWIRKHDMEADPRRYLSLVKELPQFEQIWKVGLTKLEQECRKTTYYVTNYILAPQEPSLIRALGLDAQGFRRLRANDGGCEYLAWLQWEKSSGKTISDELIAKFQSWHITSSNLQFIWDRMSAEQAYNYLSRQATETKMEVRQVLTTWKDYLSMANKLGIDTNDEIIYRARLLKQRHDELVLRMQEKDCKDEAVEVLEKYPQVDEICQSIKSKFEYAAENYVILAPNGVKDIIAEGRMLSHCVAEIDRYWDRIQQHESYILFLRRKTAPSCRTTPWKWNRTELSGRSERGSTGRTLTSTTLRSS